MVQEKNPQQVVFTNQARCRDCYRCVRVCPVKAIRIESGQAFVDALRCVSCGTCIRECPQEAKTYRRDIEKAEEILANNSFVAVSLAPSFAGIYEEWEYLRLPAALRRLGFEYVAETAVGAYLVAQATPPLIENDKKAHICTACPAVVNYIEKYDKKRLNNLLPLVSPMMAHARHIKIKYGLESKVIFVGPCVAKKVEAERREFKGLVDCVLTFEEIDELLRKKNIDLARCEESAFDELSQGKSRLFPVEGGAMATSSLETSVLDERLIFVSGFSEMKEVLGAMDGSGKPCVVEPLLCPHGCVNGAGVKKEGNVFDRRAKIIRYAKKYPSSQAGEKKDIDLSTNFKVQEVGADVPVTEENIREVLEKTGKARKEDQLNCGACGYSSCRDQAIAVVQGMAETEMCIPYMRRLAEQRSDRIMETSPNAIVVLDESLQILNTNPAFLKMFHANASCVGKGISFFVDPDPFEKVASKETEMFDDVCIVPNHSLVVRQVVYALRTEKQYVGIFSNITSGNLNAERLQKIKDETIQQAQELHAHQIAMAKNFANFLGEYTAKGEHLVRKLVEAVQDQEIADDQKP